MDRRAFSQRVAAAGVLPLFGKPEDDVRAENVGADDDAADPPSAGMIPMDSIVTVNDFVEAARRVLPRATFEYITTGSENEVTLRENVESFQRKLLLPPLLHGVQSVDMSTTLFGDKISMPVLLAPVAGQRLFHPEGTRAAARAAGRIGTICVPSTSAGHSVEEIADAATGPIWFQLYVPNQRAIAERLVRRVEAAGYKALVVTVDLGERKDADLRNKFAPPKEFLLKSLRDIGHTNLADSISFDDLMAFNATAWNLSLDAEFFGWLRSVTKLPIIMKGVLRSEDAEQAAELGVNGIVVSNHGGRRLDWMPATIDRVAAVAETAKAKGLAVLLDGGIRRGADVLKSIALGADAVMIGRPQAWALARAGEEGVHRVLEILRDELENAMIACGCANVGAIHADLIAG